MSTPTASAIAPSSASVMVIPPKLFGPSNRFDIIPGATRSILSCGDDGDGDGDGDGDYDDE